MKINKLNKFCIFKQTIMISDDKNNDFYFGNTYFFLHFKLNLKINLPFKNEKSSQL